MPYYTGPSAESEVVPFLATTKPEGTSGAPLGLFEAASFEACAHQSGTATFLTEVSSSPGVQASAAAVRSQCTDLRILPIRQLRDLCPLLDPHENSRLLDSGPYISSCPEGYRRVLDGFQGLYCLACTEGAVFLVRSSSGNRWGTETIVSYSVLQSGEVRLLEATSREFAHERFPEF
jgi:hypothetical protein